MSVERRSQVGLSAMSGTFSAGTIRVPRAPAASERSVRERMKTTRQRNTPGELGLRAELYSRGLRFRVHFKPLAEIRREADIAFPKERVAVFVDGCFWHSCPLHGTLPRTNRAWWDLKLRSNRARDADTDARLLASGWESVRFWEHENAADAANALSCTLAVRRSNRTDPTLGRAEL
jgi:DNA mismatch endonuclease, patch repair protein